MPDEVAEVLPEKKHARLGPSSSDIWLTCLGAPAEWEKHPDRPKPTSGIAAKEGTLAHVLCEAAIKIQDVPWREGMEFEVEAGTIIPVTAEMLNAVSLYAKTVMTVADIALWQAVEKRLSYGWLWGENFQPQDLFGTTDYAACDATVLYVIDFKYGRGKVVDVERNPQLLLYALGAYGLLEKERPDLAAGMEYVSLVIVQPRAGSTPVRQWTIPVGDLLYWGYTTLKPAVNKILSGEPQPLVAGNHCFFCNAAFDCPAYNARKKQRALDSFPAWVEESASAPLDRI